jgi:hypothetical protein
LLSALFGLCLGSVAAAPIPDKSAVHASFDAEAPSEDVKSITNWALHSRDHKGLPFGVVDKTNARLYVFDGRGRFLRATPVLVGMGVGDVFPPGVMEMDMYETKPWQRITPAGRFEADIFEKGRGRSTLWVDYDASIALHKMPTKKTPQRRAERMASPIAADHRITYGCINVPPAFYDAVIYPAFKPKGGIVYVLPDTMPLAAVFKTYTVGDRLQLRQTQYVAR